MKKNIYKILFTIVCMFMVIGLIVADETTPPTGDSGSDSNSSGTTAGSDSDASLGSNGKQYVIGIRVSFYTSTGVKINSQDYALDERSPSTLYTQYNSNGVPCGKMDGCSFSENWYQSGKVKGVSELSNIIGVDVTSAIKSANLSKSSLFGQMIALQDINRGKEIFNTLMVTRNVDEFYNENIQAYNIFLVWEPLGLINDLTNGKKYLGTTFELTNQIQKMDAAGLKYQTSTGKIVSVWGGLGRALTQSTGCSAYLEYPSDYVNNVSAKFNTFNANSYFNNKLVKKVDFTASSCGNMDKDVLKNYALDNTSNYAVGVLWFNEVNGGNPGSITCSNVYNFQGYGGQKKICDTIKDTGTFDFSSFNNANRGKVFPVGAEGGITPSWYLANCGCEDEACLPDFNVPSCTVTSSSSTVLYKDPTDWENCIFTKGENITTEYIQQEIPNCTDDVKKSYEQAGWTVQKYPTPIGNQLLTRQEAFQYQNNQNYVVNKVFDQEILLNNCRQYGKYIVGYAIKHGQQFCIVEKYEVSQYTCHIIKNASNNNSISKMTYLDSNLGDSEYCPVFCREEVYANFQDDNPTVLAGYHFTWGWGNVISTRTCRTSGINWTKFIQDLESANANVAYVKAELNIESQYSSNSYTKGPKCDCPLKHNECGISGCSDTSCSSDDPTTPTNEQKCASYDKVTKDCTNTTTYTWTWDGKTDYDSTVSYTKIDGSGGSQKVEQSVSATTCTASTPSAPDLASTEELTSAINSVATIIQRMKNCYTYADNSMLNTSKAYAKINYESPVYAYYDDMVKKYTSETSNNTNDCVPTTVPAVSSCSGNSCSGVSSINYCTTYERTDSDTITFEMKDDVYRYVLKNPSNLTVKSIDISNLPGYTSGSKFTVNWSDVGYGNFPVPFYLGDYKGNIIIEYGNLGHTTDGVSTEVDRILNLVDNSAPQYGQFGNYHEWRCEYNVETDLIPDGGPSDINVIYREIDLYNPFPDTNSNGRLTGANWCDEDNCYWDNRNYTVNSYILQNRNVTGDDLYGLEPMYTFIMTPSDIIQIRRYNDKNTYSSYTGSLDNNSYDFKCTTGKNRNCRSGYLTQLLTDLDAINLTGSCKNDRQVYQGSTAFSKFESCRYKGK